MNQIDGIAVYILNFKSVREVKALNCDRKPPTIQALNGLQDLL